MAHAGNPYAIDIRQFNASSRIFENVANMYKYRPKYARNLVDHISALSSTIDAGLPAIDVGAGTGVFTFDLARYLRPKRPVIGVEPNGEMRGEAIRGAAPLYDPRFVEGTATNLPFGDNSVAIVSAACAYHRFSRQAFLTECRRTLSPRGLLAIVDCQLIGPKGTIGDTIFSCLESFVPIFKRGRHSNETGGYETIDAVEEMRTSQLFTSVHVEHWYTSQNFSSEQFFGYLASMTPTVLACQALGTDPVQRRLKAIFDEYQSDGFVTLLFDNNGAFGVKSAH